MLILDVYLNFIAIAIPRKYAFLEEITLKMIRKHKFNNNMLSEMHSEPSQTSKMKMFSKIIYGFSAVHNYALSLLSNESR